MSTSASDIARRDRPDQWLTFARPAELVEISERLYRRFFVVGLWLAAGFTALAGGASFAEAGSPVRGLVVCGICAAGVACAAFRPASPYRRLRRQPWTLVLVGAVLGAGALIVGKQNLQLFLAMITILGAAGIAASRAAVANAGLVAACGLAVPQLIDGRGNLAGALVVIAPPLLFWLIVDRIAGFSLRLHQALTLASVAESRRSVWVGWCDIGEAGPVRRDTPVPRGAPLALVKPQTIEAESTRLTGRQLQVILLVCEGLRHAEIGACLDIGPQQVRRHLRNACERTGSLSTPQLVAWAHRSGLVPTDRTDRDARGATDRPAT